MSYVLPEEAISPKLNWGIIKVLVPGGPESMAIALGRWDGVPVIALRWNGTDDRPIGHPQSRGLATWFVVERGDYTEAIIEALPLEENVLVRSFITKK